MDDMLFHKHNAISYACMKAIQGMDLQLSHICNRAPQFQTPVKFIDIIFSFYLLCLIKWLVFMYHVDEK